MQRRIAVWVLNRQRCRGLAIPCRWVPASRRSGAPALGMSLTGFRIDGGTVGEDCFVLADARKRIARTDDCAISQKVRERIEQGFGWTKAIGGLRKLPMIGLAAVRGWVTSAAYNLIQLGGIGAWLEQSPTCVAAGDMRPQWRKILSGACCKESNVYVMAIRSGIGRRFSYGLLGPVRAALSN